MNGWTTENITAGRQTVDFHTTLEPAVKIFSKRNHSRLFTRMSPTKLIDRAAPLPPNDDIISQTRKNYARRLNKAAAPSPLIVAT